MTTAKTNNLAVSAMLRIDDGYIAFCIDEAAAYVLARLQAGDKPVKRADNRETADFLKKGRW